MDNYCISVGHGLKVRGAKGYIDEVDEAKWLVGELEKEIEKRGATVDTFFDTTSTTQDQNLKTIVNWHNSKKRVGDISIHFNAYETTSKPMGTECLYVTQSAIAQAVASAIAGVGFKPRGAKKRTDLYFLNNTEEPAILIEVCFVDSSADANLWKSKKSAVARALADLVRPLDPEKQVSRPATIPDNQKGITASVFGGESDPNCSAYDEDKMLNDTDLYIALPDRFEDNRPEVRVHNRQTGKSAVAEIWDVGPWNIDDPYWDKGTRPQAESGTDMSGRKTNGAGIDLSPALAKQLGVDGMGEVDWEFV